MRFIGIKDSYIELYYQNLPIIYQYPVYKSQKIIGKETLKNEYITKIKDFLSLNYKSTEIYKLENFLNNTEFSKFFIKFSKLENNISELLSKYKSEYGNINLNMD